MATVIDNAVAWAVNIANDDSHGYDQGSRWGPDYDCSSLVISAYEQAGVPVKSHGANSTHDMLGAFLKCGFQNVTDNIDLSSGSGLQKGDVLLNTQNHTALVADSNGNIVNASQNENGGTIGGATGDQSGREIRVRSYYNYPWNYVLRYPGGSSDGYTANWIECEVPNIGKALATKSYMAYQLYTNKSAAGYSYLWGSNSTTANGGLRKYKDFLCMAFGSYYGPDGTFVKIEFDDGKIIYAVKGDEKKDSETDSRHMYHLGSDANMTEFIVDQTVVTGNDAFTSALEAVGINRSSRVSRIWTSDAEPTGGGIGSISGETKEYHFADTNEKIPIHSKIFKQLPIHPTGDLYVIANGQDISRYACDISWTNTKDSLATIFNFSVPKTDGMKYINMYTPKEGDIFRFSGAEGEYFRGIIKDSDDGDRYVNKYVAVDIGWYLNECTDTYQFTNMRADECIKKICKDLCIPIVMIPELTTLITQIYIDKPISDVIKDIISQCGEIYNFDIVPDGIRIYKCTDMVVEPKFRISSNTELKDSVQYIGNTNHKITIDGMRNSVKVISDTDVLITLKDEDSVNQYGFLQEVVKLNDGEDAAAIGQTELDKLNKISEIKSGEIIEELDSYTRSGYVLTIDGVQYVIKSSQHSIQKGVHYNKIDLERVASCTTE